MSLHSATQRFAALVLQLSTTVITMERLSFKSASFRRHQVYNFPIVAPAENEDPSYSASSNQHGCQNVSYALPTSAPRLYLPLTLLRDRNPSTNLVSRRSPSTIVQVPKKTTLNETTILQHHTPPPPSCPQIPAHSKIRGARPVFRDMIERDMGQPNLAYFFFNST